MRPFKLFLLLPYRALGWRAELELVKRFEFVANRIGFECFASSSIRDARELGADCVLALHYDSAKVGPECTVGLVWNPLTYMQRAGTHAFAKTLTHDAHFYGSETLRTYFTKPSVQANYRTHDLGNFYPSAEKTNYRPIEKFGLPTYVGALWQEDRHGKLFSQLNETGSMNGYGPSHGWSRLNNIYRGAFPIDGRSYQDIYRRSGVGLCFHSDEHLAENVPGMRIFEIAASGCVAICDRHPFVQQHFGDSVYYIDTTVGTDEIVEQLDATVAEIHRSPAQAREKAEACHRIFSNGLSLDEILQGAIEKMALFNSKRFTYSKVPDPKATAEIVIRTTGTRDNLLRRALQSVASQTYENIKVTVLYHGAAADEYTSQAFPLLQKSFPRLLLKIISMPETKALSETIPAALLGSDGDFVGFLDDDDWYYPEHVQTLIEALEKNPNAAVALSGAAVDWEWALGAGRFMPTNSYTRDSSELLSFEPFGSERFQNGEMNICTAMFLIRKSAIPKDWNSWPALDIAEDRALLALLCGEDQNRCAFTSRVSCTWSYRHLQNDNRLDLIPAKSTAGFVYTGIRLPYLQTAKSDFIRYHSQSLSALSQRANKLVRKTRWIPRGIRPVTYQRQLNRVCVTILQELVAIGVLGNYHTETIQELAQLSEGLQFLRVGGQRRINHLFRQVLSAHFSETDRAVSQHTFNCILAREMDRLSRSF